MNSMPSVEGPTRPEAVVDLAGSPPEEQDSEREEEVTASATAAMNGGMRASEPEPEPPSEPSAQNLRRAASRAIHGRDIPVRAGTSAALATRSGGDVTGTDTGTGAGMGSEERQHPERSESLGFTDLDLMVSQLEREGAHYEVSPSPSLNLQIFSVFADLLPILVFPLVGRCLPQELAAIGEFLGPAKSSKASAEEVSALPVGRVEVERRRVNKEGRVKQKLSVVGVRVDKCAICLNQFRADQMACVFPCLHM